MVFSVCNAENEIIGKINDLIIVVLPNNVSDLLTNFVKVFSFYQFF